MSSFQFKHFSIRQTNAAMKIGTDALLLGSLCTFNDARTLLDIGTGTGVLSMMLAQRFNPDSITALEINSEAVKDARFNFEQSPFKTEFNLLHQDLRVWNTEARFDGIISNPPFFENSSKSESNERNTARHTDDLPFDVLFSACSALLSETGRFWIIVPTTSRESSSMYAEAAQLYLNELIHIHGKLNRPVRIILAFSKQQSIVKERTLTVRDETGNYTNEYIELTRDFHSVDLASRQKGNQ